MENELQVNYTIRTEGEAKIHTLLWSLPCFLKLLDSKTTRDIRSDNSQFVKQIDGTIFQLKLQIFGSNSDLIEVYYMAPYSAFIKAIFTICLKRFEERTMIIKEYQTIQAKKWQYLATLFKRDIIGVEDSYLLSDGTLRLKLQFHVNNDVKIDHPGVPEAQLSCDFENLLNNGLFSDILMKSIEGIDYKVHKAVVASRSVVLKAHFEHNTTECYTNIVESPLESEVLREVLTFIYSDKAPRVNEIPEKLLAAADFYQLKRLKSLAEEALHKRLTVDNAIETLELADVHSSPRLKQLTLEFIKDGQAKLITKTDGWKRVRSVELIKTIYEYIVDDNVDPDIK